MEQARSYCERSRLPWSVALLAMMLAPSGIWGMQSRSNEPKDLPGFSKSKTAKGTLSPNQSSDAQRGDAVTQTPDLMRQGPAALEVEIARLKVTNERISKQLEEVSKVNEITHLRPLDFVLLGLVLMALLIVAIPSLWDRYSQSTVDPLTIIVPKLNSISDAAVVLNRGIAELRVTLDNISRQHILLSEKLDSKQEPPKATSVPLLAPIDKVRDLCKLYNECRPDPNKWAEFLNRFQPIHFVCTNASERLADQDLAPVFQTTTDGTFLAIQIDGIGYVGVPFLSTPVDTYNYGPGAMGHMFECLNFGRSSGYQSLILLKPALLRSEGDSWRIAEKGKLQVQQSARSGVA